MPPNNHEFVYKCIIQLTQIVVAMEQIKGKRNFALLCYLPTRSEYIKEELLSESTLLVTWK